MTMWKLQHLLLETRQQQEVLQLRPVVKQLMLMIT
jgi:hypothetical protein